MSTAILNVKLEPEIKKEAQEVADKLGLSLSAIVRAYLRELIRTRRVEFSAEEPSDFLISSLKTAEKDVREGRISPTFSKADDAIAWLKDSKRDNEN